MRNIFYENDSFLGGLKIVKMNKTIHFRGGGGLKGKMISTGKKHSFWLNFVNIWIKNDKNGLQNECKCQSEKDTTVAYNWNFLCGDNFNLFNKTIFTVPF